MIHGPKGFDIEKLQGGCSESAFPSDKEAFQAAMTPKVPPEVTSNLEKGRIAPAASDDIIAAATTGTKLLTIGPENPESAVLVDLLVTFSSQERA